MRGFLHQSIGMSEDYKKLMWTALTSRGDTKEMYGPMPKNVTNESILYFSNSLELGYHSQAEHRANIESERIAKITRSMCK